MKTRKNDNYHSMVSLLADLVSDKLRSGNKSSPRNRDLGRGE
jgi:hypothetical protein